MSTIQAQYKMAFSVVVCPKCSIPFGVPEHRLASGGTIYCPHGHSEHPIDEKQMESNLWWHRFRRGKVTPIEFTWNLMQACCVACSLPFLIPQEFRELFRGEESGGFTCPNGHSIYFLKPEAPSSKAPHRLNGHVNGHDGRNRLGLGSTDLVDHK